jgi:hypothetical protein
MRTFELKTLKLSFKVPANYQKKLSEQKNNNLYTVSILVYDLFYGPKNEEIIKNLWDSVKFD